MHVLQTLVRDAIVGGEVPVVIVNRGGGGGGDDGTGGGGRLAAALADEGPAVHLELREDVRRQDERQVEELADRQVERHPRGAVVRGQSVVAGRHHPRGVQRGHPFQVRTEKYTR